MEGNVETLAQENAQLRRELAELAKRVKILTEQNAWLKQRFFGRRSEALSQEEQRQLKLFDEAEATADTESDSTQGQAEQVRVPEHVRQRPKRRPLPQALPREEVIIDIPEEQKRCACGAMLVRIDEEVSEKLDANKIRITGQALGRPERNGKM